MVIPPPPKPSNEDEGFMVDEENEFGSAPKPPASPIPENSSSRSTNLTNLPTKRKAQTVSPYRCWQFMTSPTPAVGRPSSFPPYKNAEGDKKTQVADMFNNISKTYDFLNHFMSLGIDIIWRKKAIRSLRSIQPQLMLDVATGTGDFALESIKILNPKKIIGVDISEGMLQVAQEKIKSKGLQQQFEVQLGDSEKLLFEDNTFDAVTVAFGVRNFENLEQGLADICRVLKTTRKSGQFLEFFPK
ncbi:hypothetical protein FQR65_LT17394 [Abscondita terminalis]|nr:hypothetical protein FQR65_LT17394 [Abscondita terminalis]